MYRRREYCCEASSRVFELIVNSLSVGSFDWIKTSYITLFNTQAHVLWFLLEQ